MVDALSPHRCAQHINATEGHTMTTNTARVPRKFLELLDLGKLLGKAMPVGEHVTITERPFNFERSPISIVAAGNDHVSADCIAQFILESEREFIPSKFGERKPRSAFTYQQLLSRFAVICKDGPNIITEVVCHPSEGRGGTVADTLNRRFETGDRYHESKWLPANVLATVEWQAWVYYNGVEDPIAERAQMHEHAGVIPAFRTTGTRLFDNLFPELKANQLTPPKESLFRGDDYAYDWVFNQEVIWINKARVQIDWKKVRRCVEEILRKHASLSGLAQVATVLETKLGSTVVRR